MNRIHSIILILSILLVSFTTYAQKSATKSMAILDNASQLFEQAEGIKLSFTLSADSPDEGMFTTQEGIAFIKKDKFKIEMPYSTVWFNGKTQWVLLKDADEVNISNPSPEELNSISPLGILSMYKTNYILKEPVFSKFNGKPSTIIEMTAKNKLQDFKYLTVTLDSQTKTIVMIQFTTNDGNKNKLLISNYSSNNKLSNDIFQFNKHNYPNVEVIDLR